MRVYRIIISALQLATLATATTFTDAVPPVTKRFFNSSVTAAAQASTATASYMTIAVTNVYGTALSLSLAADANSPTPLNNPQPTLLPNSASTRYIYPTGWAGRISVGETTNVGNSLIEGSYTNEPYIDVSYVDGYSVPITCSCNGIPVTGCNIDLFNQPGITCDDEVEGDICLNPIRDSRPSGPPAPFFAACAGAAYTFSEDDTAVYSCPGSISCCIGTSCKAPSRQPGEARTVPTCSAS
jgi:hypothetical protein